MSDARDGQADSWALFTRLNALGEAGLIAPAFGRALGGMGDAGAVQALEHLVQGVRLGQPACLAVYFALLDPDAWLGLLGRPRIESLYEEAQRATAALAMIWLYAVLAPPEAKEVETSGDAQDLVHRELKAMPLGNRRALARSARGEQVKRLVGDPDGGVMVNFLNNPHVTEALVLAVASRRPTLAEPLLVVARHPRWNTAYRVRQALCRNPHFPRRFGLTLLVSLRAPDLEAFSHDGTVHEDLQLAAARLFTAGPHR